MRLVVFRGATAFEAQAGRFWVKILRPRYINRRSLRQLVQIGIDRSKG